MNTSTNNAAFISTLISFTNQDDDQPTNLMDAVFYALDHDAIQFNRVAKRGSLARGFANTLSEADVKSIFVDESDEFDKLTELEPEAANLIGLAVEFGVRFIAGETPSSIADPRWINTEEWFVDALDFEANATRTNQGWVQWMLDTAKLNDRYEAVYASLSGVLDELYDAGVVHGRFYVQQSLAWSAWSGIGFSLVGLAEFPQGEQAIIDGCTVMASLIRIHSLDASQAIATKDAGEFLDVMNEESGKMASSFVSLTTGPGSQKQRAPFPEDFAELFANELANFAKNKAHYAAKQAAIKSYGLDELEAAITGEKTTRHSDAAVAAALAAFGK